MTMYPNTLRPSVKHGESEPLRALLPIVGAIRTAKYERPCQLAFIERGVQLLRYPVNLDLHADGWGSLSGLLAEVDSLNLLVFACIDCASHEGIVPDDRLPLKVQWLPSTDMRFPSHQCVVALKPRNLVTVSLQRRAQSEFDERVGKKTGAY